MCVNWFIDFQIYQTRFVVNITLAFDTYWISRTSNTTQVCNEEIYVNIIPPQIFQLDFMYEMVLTLSK